MNPEQLDEIENRQAAAMWIGGPTAAFAQDTLLLVKALREAGQMEAVAKAFHDVAVKERDYERVRGNRIEKERDEARAEATRQTERLMQSEELTDQLHKERDEARAEVERLREAARQIAAAIERAADVKAASVVLGEPIGGAAVVYDLRRFAEDLRQAAGGSK